MNTNEVTILAKSQPKESYNFEGQLSTEWGIKKIDNPEEIDSLFSTYASQILYKSHNPIAVLRRNVYLINNTPSYQDWEILDFADGDIAAIRSVGDSAYNTAISIDSRHADEIIRRNAITKVQDELNKLEDSIIPNKYEKMSKLQKEYQNKYDQELKRRKLYTKVQNSLADCDLLDMIRSPFQEDYKLDLEEITIRIDRLKLVLRELRG